MLTTDTITYNVRERGRKARGQNRNFDTAALARIINGDAVQEQVKHGDLLGYFGHWPRLKFGLPAVESGIVDGKVVPTPLAIRVVELSADVDGTIRHRCEFMDTAEGVVAQKLYNSKAGGFSSVIDVVPGTLPSMPRAFFGFDYVLEPNFTRNRGHKVVLDGAQEMDTEALLDHVMAQAAIAEGELSAMFDSLHAQHMDALKALERVSRENDLLIGRLASGCGLLDSAGHAIAPLRGVTLNFDQYMDSPLSALAKLPDNTPEQNTAETNYLRNRFGWTGN